MAAHSRLLLVVVWTVLPCSPARSTDDPEPRVVQMVEGFGAKVNARRELGESGFRLARR
jgi:hypothetical protein